MLNETHLFVASGKHDMNSPSPRNYLLDINSEQWTQVADRSLEASECHSTGTFWNSTAGEIQIANVGAYGIEVYSPKDASWQQVPFPSPPLLWRSKALQQGTDSFILIGGDTNLEDESGDIYLFDENGLSILKENALRVPRESHAIIPISKEDFTCN